MSPGAGVNVSRDLDPPLPDRAPVYPTDPASEGDPPLSRAASPPAILTDPSHLNAGSAGLHDRVDHWCSPSSTILDLAERITKRSSGYRMMQLFVGSEGTLGVITG